MRYVIFLLVALNCTYFVWQILLNAPDKPVEHELPPLPPNVGPLVMLKESVARHSPGIIRKIEDQTAAQPPGAVFPLSCQALGPFLAASELSAFEKRIDRLGLTASPRTRYHRERVGYTVLLPFTKYEDALQTKRRLEKENITANFVGLGNTLSLGAFREKPLAEKTLERAHALGLEPHLEPGYAKRSTYWLVFQEHDNPGKGLKNLTRMNPDLRVETTACR